MESGARSGPGLALAAAAATVCARGAPGFRGDAIVGLEALARALLVPRAHRVAAAAAFDVDGSVGGSSSGAMASIAAAAAAFAAASFNAPHLSAAAPALDAVALLAAAEADMPYARGRAREGAFASFAACLFCGDARVAAAARRPLLLAAPSSSAAVRALALALRAARARGGPEAATALLGGDGTDARAAWDAGMRARPGASALELLVGALVAAPLAVPWEWALGEGEGGGGRAAIASSLLAAAGGRGDAPLAAAAHAAAALVTLRLSHILVAALAPEVRAVFTHYIDTLADMLPTCVVLLVARATPRTASLRSALIELVAAVALAAPLRAGFSLLLWTPGASAIARARGGAAAAAADKGGAALHYLAKAARTTPVNHALHAALQLVLDASDDARAEDREATILPY